jgi:NAD(P)-dependent dehydrogenase (short-subunit alcohol dehydrogenase family)
VALVSNGCSDLDIEIAVILARNGYHTYVACSNSNNNNNNNDDKSLSFNTKLEQISVNEKLKINQVFHDKTEPKSVSKSVDLILETENNTIDLLVNTPTQVLLGCVEDLALEDIRGTFEKNFFNVFELIQHVLPSMRHNRSGKIINIGSVAGRMGFPMSSAFVSSQFALEGLSESLRYELEPFGVGITIIEPGMMRLMHIDKYVVLSERARQSDSVYYSATKNLVENIKKMIEMATPPSAVAQTVLKAAHANPLFPRYIAGNDAAMIIESRRSMTDMEFELFVKKVLLDKQ